MGEESVKGANLGVILIIFAAILALGLIVFMLARNMANTGLTNVSEKLQAAEESEYTDFDGTVVVGQRVHAALAGFKGKKVAILIATQGFTDKLAQEYKSDAIPAAWVGVGTGTDEGVVLPNLQGTGGLLLDTANIKGRENMKLAYAVGPDGTSPLQTSTSSGVDKVTTFIQYNALLESTNNVGNVAEGDEGGHTVIKYDNGTYTFDGAFRTYKGKVVFDLEFSNLSKVGCTEMVPGAARFHANLLKDATA